MGDRVALAYSGGVDTTVAVHWLRKEKSLDVIAVAVDVGQHDDISAICERALKAGAADAVQVEATQEFAEEFVAPALRANARYQDKYPLVSALSRPLICRHLVAAAREHDAAYVAHGCTGKGNDQVRFEVSLGALAPDLTVIAPVRDWGMTRDRAIEVGLEAGLPLTVDTSSPYSIDENLWGRTIECGALEDPMVEPPADVWERTGDPFHAPREPRYLEVSFEDSLPVSLDGNISALHDLIAEVEKVAGVYGVGRIDMIEDRVVGIKSREIYEVPAAEVLITAHSDLEELTLERDLLRTKRSLEARYAQLVYEGHWYSPLREAIDAFNRSTSRHVEGDVRLRLEPSSARVVGRRSEDSLYDYALATYDAEDAYDHSSGAGFSRVWGLPLKVWARMRDRGEK